MKNAHSAERPISKLTCVAALSGWLALCAGAMAILISLDMRVVDKQLSQYGSAYTDQLNRDMVSSETILKGFSALFSAVGNTEPEKVSRYVRSVIAANNQIFALEIAQKVSHDQLAAFVSGKRKSGDQGFDVKSFSYDSDRKWLKPETKPFYYPIIYMEPTYHNSKDILGLDVESVPFLKTAMTESLSKNVAVASHPFRLVEGNLAYVMFCPVLSEDGYIVNMVIDTSKLTEPAGGRPSTGVTAVLYHKDFPPDDPNGQLFVRAGEARSVIEGRLFPQFEYQNPLKINGEPFIFRVTRQTGWEDLSLGLLSLMAFLTFISSLMLVGYMRNLQRQRQHRIENHQRMWKLATHDTLTGIPNRMLLMDRLSQALLASERSGHYGALIFLDLDDFKVLNDSMGHDAGDMLLVEVAKRLRDNIRDIDTVARFGGDEFIVILGELGNVADDALHTAELVTCKIREALDAPYDLSGYEYNLTVSLGLSMFYGSQKGIEDLLKAADMAMYQAKTSRQGTNQRT